MNFSINDAKICIIQHIGTNDPKYAANTLYRILDQLSHQQHLNMSQTDSKTNNALPDIVVFPENWIRGHPCREVMSHPIVDAIRPVVAQFQVYTVLGSLMEMNSQRGGKPFITCPVLDRNGNLIGAYRKRYANDLKIEDGKEPCILNLDGIGTVGILLCRDFENEEIFHATLRFNPRIIINPIYIPSRSGYLRQQKDEQIYSTWRVACDSMSKRFERRCKETGVVLIRCDQPVSEYTSSMGTSQVIAPHFSIRGPDMYSQWWTTVIPQPKYVQYDRYASLMKPPQRDRTQRDDNIGNRYNSRQLVLRDSINGYFPTDPIRHSVICDRMHVASAADDVSGNIIINNMHTLLSNGCIQAHKNEVTALEPSLYPTSGMLWSAGMDGMIKHWNVKQRLLIREWDLNADISSEEGFIYANTLCSTSKYLFMGLSNGRLATCALDSIHHPSIHIYNVLENINIENSPVKKENYDQNSISRIQLHRYKDTDTFLFLYSSSHGGLHAKLWSDENGRFITKDPYVLFSGSLNSFSSVIDSNENTVIVHIFHEFQCSRIQIDFFNQYYNQDLPYIKWTNLDKNDLGENQIVRQAKGIHRNACLVVMHQSAELWLITFQRGRGTKLCSLYSCNYTRDLLTIDFNSGYQKHKAITLSDDGQVQVWEFIQNAMPHDLINAFE